MGQSIKKQITILGCGWLGLPLGEYLTSKGYSVKGSTTTEAVLPRLKEKNITPYLLKISDTFIDGDNLESFFNSEILIINFPPERRPDIEDYHMAQFRLLTEQLKVSPVKKVVLVSSTSVYPDVNREVDEEETALPEKGSGRALKQVEALLMGQENFTTTVVRFAGLIGGDRMPGRFLAAKKNVENGDAPVNLIHRDDCIEIIYQIIHQEVWGEIFNACSDKHPLRKDYYIKAAKAIGLEAPTFASTSSTSFKIINSEKLKKRLNYTFKYPDPMEIIEVKN